MTEYQEKGFLQGFIDWFETLVVSLSVVSVALLFLCSVVYVDGSSMRPGLNHLDRLVIVSAYFPVKRGDVVVVRRESDKPLVKRVIATEGQTVDIDYEKGVVLVNGRELEEPYVLEDTKISTAETIPFPAKVPEDHIFVMGDNRNDSQDSRNKDIGMIHKDQLIGRACLRVFPLDQFGLVE